MKIIKSWDRYGEIDSFHSIYHHVTLFKTWGGYKLQSTINYTLPNFLMMTAVRSFKKNVLDYVHKQNILSLARQIIGVQKAEIVYRYYGFIGVFVRETLQLYQNITISGLVLNAGVYYTGGCMSIKEIVHNRQPLLPRQYTKELLTQITNFEDLLSGVKMR